MKTKKCSLILLVIVLIGIMTFVGGPSPAQAAADTPAKTLTIGTLLQLSDWYSVVDAGEQGDCKIVAQIINDRGGLTIKGQKYNIELAIEDGKSSLDGNTAAANKLVLDDKVKFVIGPSAFFSAASSPIFEAAKVIHVSGYCTLQPGELGPTTPYGFLGFDTAIPQQYIALKALKNEYPNVKNIVLVTFDDGSLKYLAPRLKKMVADMGFNLIGDVVSFAQEMQDYSPIAAKLNAIAKADAYVIVIATPPMQVGIMKGVRTLGNQKPITATMPGPDVLAMGGQIAANNVLAICTLSPE